MSLPLDLAADIARRTNPTVINIGEDQLGTYYNVVWSDGRQTSIIVPYGVDLDQKVAETIGKFEAPPKCK
jgi:Fe-S cluster assembly scaffold protein SufB